MKPLIGITAESRYEPDNLKTQGKIELNWNYAEQIALAGGNPIILTPMSDLESLIPLLDGWLIPGGRDIDPAHYNQPPHPMLELQHPSRFELEKRLFELLPQDFPIFGICYGCQLLNVLHGGSLYQHLPDTTEHDIHTGGTEQTYRLEGNFSKLFGCGKTAGKSYHHQAIQQLGRGLSAVAWHEDGTIEAIESAERPGLLAVQWHPERSPDNQDSKKLFMAFVERARQYHQRKNKR